MEEVYHEHQPETKFCNSCKQEKALSEYRAWKKGKFGVRPRCAQCERDYAKETYIYTEERNGHTKRPRPPKSDKEGFKYCSICLEEKELTLFHFRDGKPIARCIQCEQESDKARWNKRYQRRTQKLPEVSQPGHKVCNTCFREKPYEGFAKDPAQSDKHRGRCRECYSEMHNDVTEEEKEERRIRRAEDDKNRIEKIREADRKRYRENEKRKLDHLNQLMERNRLTKETVKDTVDLKEVLNKHGRHCYICNQEILPSDKLAFDHVIPLKPRKGEPRGTHTMDNIRPTHRICNGRKTNKRFEDLTPFDRRGPDR